MRRLGWLLWKEALVEARGLERLSTLVVFSAAVLITLQFAVPPGSPARPVAAGGFIWATLLFASMLEMRRTFDSERRDGTLDGLRAAPIEATTVLASKLLAAFAVLAVLAAVLVPAGTLFFTGSLSGAAPATGVALLGLAGLLGWGMLLGALSGQTRSGELVLPVLLFGLVVPQTIACVRLIGHFLGSAAAESPSTGFAVLVGAGLLSLGTTVLLFDYALEE